MWQAPQVSACSTIVTARVRWSRAGTAVPGHKQHWVMGRSGTDGQQPLPAGGCVERGQGWRRHHRGLTFLLKCKSGFCWHRQCSHCYPISNGRVTPSEGQRGLDQGGTKHPGAGAGTWGDLITYGLPVLLLSGSLKGSLLGFEVCVPVMENTEQMQVF